VDSFHSPYESAQFKHECFGKYDFFCYILHTMELSRIRNFSIIAHIDHGKSTLADRMLEITGTIEKRKMQEQVLDSMELERERGITIKMQPVRMKWRDYTLNLIDTPGHIDFSYEVSRAIKAVEGSILLVDATQGVQAQTLTTLNMAREAVLTIIPVVSKIDSPLARTSEVREELAKLLGVPTESVLAVSGKTGEGVSGLLDALIKRVPPPKEEMTGSGSAQGLIFDFQYSNHKGVVIFTRIIEGEIGRKDKILLKAAKREFAPLEVGIFAPDEVSTDALKAGEIGYVVTGIKEPGIAFIGDTITLASKPLPTLPGYMSTAPVVWASIYPESQDDFDLLRQSLMRLRLSDSSFTHEEESSGILGRGFRCGFLGMLHLEIITERLRREFRLELVVTTPSITYEVTDKKGQVRTIYSPVYFPEYGDVMKVREPWVNIKIITPSEYLGAILTLLYEHEAEVFSTDNFGENRVSISLSMPLRELMRNFFDSLKSVSSGYASLTYEISDTRDADVVKLDILVADEIVPAFSRVVSRKRADEEGESLVEKLHSLMPRQLIVTKIQAKAMGRILSSRSLSAMRKDVTGYLYGGDITRKKKLWEKQKKGKKKMQERGRVNIPPDVFLKMIQGK